MKKRMYLIIFLIFIIMTYLHIKHVTPTYVEKACTFSVIHCVINNDCRTGDTYYNILLQSTIDKSTLSLKEIEHSNNTAWYNVDRGSIVTIVYKEFSDGNIKVDKIYINKLKIIGGS